jgi:alpha-D-xyloside xylohydrolase
MIMDFNGDSAAIQRKYQFMFGKTIMVSPVIEPGVTDQEVYLPKSALWYDFWTGKRYEGGQAIITPVSSDKIPLFVKAGSILPWGKTIQYSGEKPADTLEIRIYTGVNGAFTLYEDEGDGYDYEKGMYSEIPFMWNDAEKELVIGERKGSFPGMLSKRVFNIVRVSPNAAGGMDLCERPEVISNYLGKRIRVKLK